MYRVPEKYYYRLHHVRPRFKNDIENVLLYMASKISKLEKQSIDMFNKELFDAIRQYPGNLVKKEKTINNWRTEISALFGFIEENKASGLAAPGKMAKKLTEEQDLVQFFKYFLFYFQYPGTPIKANKMKKLIEKNIKFKPVQYFLNVFIEGEKITGSPFYINKAEATHFIYNDLRVTRDNCKPKVVVKRILESRTTATELDWSGDTIRYAGDILDYMVIADLLIAQRNKFYLNHYDRETAVAFVESRSWFDGYDHLYASDISLDDIKPIEEEWFNYVNRDLDKDLFKTDIIKYLGIDEKEYSKIIEEPTLEGFEDQFKQGKKVKTKEIGDYGENLVIGHECMKLKNAGKNNLIHLVKKIPTHLAVGYDIQSIELNEIKKLIEVKTTLSFKSINFFNFHLTINEWRAAESYKDVYFVYRLFVSKKEQKLFIIRDPVCKYKQEKLKIMPRNGMDIYFSEESGKWEKLLIWKN